MPSLAPVTCPHCGSCFEPRRRDQKYCSPNCRKGAYQKKDRAKNPRNARNSWAVRRENSVTTERMMRLTQELYGTSVKERLGFLKDIVDQARAGDARLRSVLANLHFLRASFGDMPHLFFRRCWAYPNVTKAADKYCRRFWDAGVIDVVMNRVPEPETGEAASPVFADRKSVVTTNKEGYPQVIGFRSVEGSSEDGDVPEHVSIPFSDLKPSQGPLPGFLQLLTQFDLPNAA